MEARRRPPLPAPTESSPFPTSGDDKPGTAIADIATDLSRRTDKTSFSIPEDGSPITINTEKRRERSKPPAKGPVKSNTSLLIEYFEAGKGPNVSARPSVRVKVTPSAAKKNRDAGDHHIQITEAAGGARKPSYTRRISLGPRHAGETHILEGDDISSLPEDSNLSARAPPIEVEVLHKDQSDVSGTSLSRDNRYVPIDPSQISSMPPESVVSEELTPSPTHERSRSFAKDAAVGVGLGAAAATAVSAMDTLKAPSRRRSRSLSRERITQKAIEKIKNDPGHTRHKSGKSRSRSVSKEQLIESMGSPRSGKHRRRSNEIGGGESMSLLPASQVSDARSFRSGTSTQSSVTNPKLLATVEDCIRRLILPELTALKAEQKTQQNLRTFEKGRRDSVASASTASREELGRKVSKHASAPNVRKLSHSERSERKHKHRDKTYESPSEQRSFERGMSEETVIRDERPSKQRSREGHGLRNAALGAVAGGLLTRAALKSHDSHSSLDRSSDKRERRRKRSKDHSAHSRSRSHSVSTTDPPETVDEIFERADVPPMPMRSAITTSDVTRDSILSERTSTPASERQHTEIRQVARGSPQQVISPGSRTPVKETGFKKNETYEQDARNSPSREHHYGKAALAGAAAAAGLVGAKHAVDQYDSYDEAGYEHNPRALSPIQSEASFEAGDDATPHESKIHHARSANSVRSAESAAFAARSNRPKGISLESGSEIMGPHDGMADLEGGVGGGKDPRVDSWYVENSQERYRDSMGHESSDRYRDSMASERDERYRDSMASEGDERYRDSMAESTDRYRDSVGADSYDDPRTVDVRHLTQYTDDSLDAPHLDKVTAAQEIRGLGANVDYIATPHAVESAVASLHEPSLADGRSTRSGPSRQDGYGEASELSRDSAALDRGSPLKQTHNADDEIRIDHEYDEQVEIKSPRQSVARSLDGRASATSLPKMTARAEPTAHDPMPEFVPGMVADSRPTSDISTNPPAIQGPRGGPPLDAPFDWSHAEPASPVKGSDAGANDKLKATAAHMLGVAAGLTTGAALASRKGKDSYEQESFDDPTRDLHEQPEDVYAEPHLTAESPLGKDEGYITEDPHARSAGALTPDHRGKGVGLFPDSSDAAADAMAMGTMLAETDDPFTNGRSGHTRNVSGNSHGMPSPVYDSSTGRGIDRIHSKDIVALMDHVRCRSPLNFGFVADERSSPSAMLNATLVTRRSWSLWCAAPPRCATHSRT